MPKYVQEAPSAKRDKFVNLCTRKKQIKNVLVNNYKECLKPNKMEESLKDLEEEKKHCIPSSGRFKTKTY